MTSHPDNLFDHSTIRLFGERITMVGCEFRPVTMTRRRSNRSARLDDEADIVYTIDTPFQNRDAKILLIDRGSDRVEVTIGNIPTPSKYRLDKNYPGNLENEETMRTHAAAKWIVTESLEALSNYDWETSDYKTNNPNYHLRDVYFTCSYDEVDDAVMAAKQFIMALEQKSRQHAREFEISQPSPSEELRG